MEAQISPIWKDSRIMLGVYSQNLSNVVSLYKAKIMDFRSKGGFHYSVDLLNLNLQHGEEFLFSQIVIEAGKRYLCHLDLGAQFPKI